MTIAHIPKEAPYHQLHICLFLTDTILVSLLVLLDGFKEFKTICVSDRLVVLTVESRYSIKTFVIYLSCINVSFCIFS